MKKHILRLFILGFFTFIQSVIPTALAGVNQWTSAGPDGGYIRALVIDQLTPSILYAANGKSVYKSINDGASWSAANTGLITNNDISTLAINQTNPSIIYAGTYDNGIFNTSNGGGSWSAINSGIPSKFINALAIDQSSPNTLYAGIFNYGIFKSTNAGSSWSQINTGLTDSSGLIDVRTIVVDRNNPNTLYVGGRGVFKSINGGGSWSPVNIGLTDANSFAYYVYGLVIDRNNSNTLYAGTSRGVFKSINGGGNWNPVNNGLTPTSIWAIALDQSNPNILFAGASYGGLFKSTNAGSSWSPVTTGYPSADIQAIAINPSNSTILYVGIGSKGVYKSIDSGASWDKSSYNLPSTDPFFALTVDPKNQAILYLGSQFDLYKSNDAGQSWNSSSSGLSSTDVRTIAIDTSDSSIIYAGVYNNLSTFNKSIDGGNNWKTYNLGMPQNAVVMDLVIDPNTPSTLYAGVVGESPEPSYATRDSGVYKSTNSGASWNSANNGLSNIQPTVLVIDKSNPSTLFVGTFDLGSTYPNFIYGLYKSTDGGASWNSANSGLPSNLYIHALAINPKNSAIIYAVIGNFFSSEATGGVYKSINGGASWNPVNTDLITKLVQALAIDPNKPDTLYAGTYDGGVFRSINGGGNWSPYNAGLSGTESVTLMTIDSANPATLYAGFSDFGIFKITGSNGIPVVTANPAMSVTPTSATLNGTVNPNGYATTAQFEYGLTTAYGSTASVTLSPNNGTTAQNVSAAINGLLPGQTYHFRLTATNSQGTGTGSDMSFATVAAASTTTLTSSANPSTYAQSVTFTATVSGSGVTPTGTVTFKAENLAIASCGTNGVVSLTNGIAACTSSSLTVAGSPHAITADYSGNGAYNASSGTLTSGQTVNKANASVTTWPTASAITYGQTLASSTLSGGAATPAGSFAFTLPATMPNAGTAAQSVTFTPTDTANYNTATNTVSVTVNKADSSVTAWPTASAITYGQTLASSTLSGGVATPAGSFAFALPSIAPTVGTAAQSVTYTPTNTANYNTASGTVNVTVNKAGQTISFGAAPTVIVGGTGTVSATSTSGLTVTFGSTTPTICTTGGTNGSTVTGVAADSCTIAANQAGNANYNAAQQVTQTFSVSTGISLTVTNLNVAGGIVGNNPSGIYCGPNCNSYAAGTVVTLFPLPAVGSFFTGWSMVCHGKGATCQITMDQPKAVTANFGLLRTDSLVFDFNPYGLWLRHGNGAWEQLLNLPTSQLVPSDLDGNGVSDLVVDFNPYGLWKWMNRQKWENFHGSPAKVIAAADLDGNGKADLAIDFAGSAGLWEWQNNQNWAKFFDLSSKSITAAYLDENDRQDLVIDFAPYGLWQLLNGQGWVKFNDTLSPTASIAADLDGNGHEDLVFGFGPDGLWAWMNNQTWVKLHGLSPLALAAADLDGNGKTDVAINFGQGTGLWAWMNNHDWVKLHGLAPSAMAAAYLDANPQQDLVVDFAPNGIWTFKNNQTWEKLFDLPARRIVAMPE